MPVRTKVLAEHKNKMNQKIEKIQHKDLPNSLIERIQNELRHYAVILLGVNTSPNGEKGGPIGSGTLVQLQNNKYGILTVQHVTSLLKKFNKLGLLLETHTHRFTIDTNVLTIIEVGAPSENSKSPDLALIILPENVISTIKAIKSFWNIFLHQKEILSKSFNFELALCFSLGLRGDCIRTEGPTTDFGQQISCCCCAYYSGIEKYWTEKEFDYLNLSVLYENRTDLPRSFGGLSGGGIWEVELNRPNNKEINYSKPLLIGVAFYETEIKNSSRSIIGHGWRSIYEQLPKVVESKII